MLEVFGGNRGIAFLVGILVDHGHRWLGEDRQRRHDDFELVAAAVFLQRQEGFVFPGQQHVALTVVDEGDGRATGAGVEYRYMLEQLLHIGLGLVFATA
ncbi:hypothetical protein D3C80_1921220 [compost metagenome]